MVSVSLDNVIRASPFSEKTLVTHQGHFFIAVNCAKFRGTATSQKREFRGHFAAKIDNFAAISRPKF